MGIFNKLFKSKEELERLKELEENKKRALNEYKYQLNDYSKKLASFEELINMEAKRKNKLLNQSYKLNQKKYNNLLNKTILFNNTPSTKQQLPPLTENKNEIQQHSVVGNKEISTTITHKQPSVIKFI